MSRKQNDIQVDYEALLTEVLKVCAREVRKLRELSDGEEELDFSHAERLSKYASLAMQMRREERAERLNDKLSEWDNKDEDEKLSLAVAHLQQKKLARLK